MSNEPFPIDRSRHTKSVRGVRVLGKLLALSVALLATGSSHAQMPDPEALLEETAARYGQARSYHFVAAEKTVTSSGEDRRETATLVLTARDGGGRTRVEFDDRINAGVAVFDGHEHWVYLPRQARFAKVPAPDAAPGASQGGVDFEAVARRFIDRYRSAGERVIQAKIAGSETVSMRAGDVDAWVAEASYSPPPGMRDGRIQRTYWIAKTSGLIVRELSNASMTQPNTGRTVTVTQDIEFQVAQAEEPIDAELFTFAPPPGARRVESLGAATAEEGETADLEAPDFTLPGLDGEEVTLSALRGKVVLLDFWASWCAPCRHDMPFVQRLHDEFEEEGLRAFGVNAEPPERARAYLDQTSLDFPTLFDSGMRVTSIYRVRAIPTFVVIDRQGRLAAYLQGAQTYESLKQALVDAGL